jgi:hypothetical protein
LPGRRKKISARVSSGRPFSVARSTPPVGDDGGAGTCDAETVKMR